MAMSVLVGVSAIFFYHWPNGDECLVGVSVIFFYHWPSGDDRFKLVFLTCMIIGQMAMTVPSWCFCHVLPLS